MVNYSYLRQLKDTAKDIFESEDNYNNADKTSGQRVYTLEEIETKLFNGERI